MKSESRKEKTAEKILLKVMINNYSKLINKLLHIQEAGMPSPGINAKKNKLDISLRKIFNKDLTRLCGSIISD